MKADLEIASLPLFGRGFVAGPLVGAAIPQDDFAGAVVPCRNRAFEVSVVQGMVFDVNGQPLHGRIQGRAVGEGPGLEYTVHFQPKIVVQPPGAMSLNKKAVALAGMDRSWRLGSFCENPFSAV